MYKVFIRNKAVILGEFNHGSKKMIKNLNYLEVLQSLKDSGSESLAFHSANLSKDWQDFKCQFEVREAAGGVVLNEKRDALFIFRNDVWDIPKGHLEYGETHEEGALREVIEECGVRNIEIQSELPTTYHVYEYEGRAVLKITYWYQMNGSSLEELIPQTEEGIQRVEWVSRANLNKIQKNTYASLNEVIDAINW